MGTQTKRAARPRWATWGLLGGLLTPLLAGLLTLAAPAGAQTGNDWRVGNRINLAKGTQIRQGPGFGYCYHTIVPVDNWAVQVINGPRSANGVTWYDTSRKAAGDPSGGTGWVNIQQVDDHPSVLDPGTPCNPVVVPPGGPTPTPTAIPPPKITIPKFLIDLFTWWHSQALLVRIGIVVVAFLLLPLTLRLGAFGSGALIRFVRAVLWGIILGGLADLTRAIWEPSWLALPLGNLRGLDPAVVLLLAPLGWWAFGYIAAAATIGIALGVLLLVILILLFYFYYLAALIRAT